MAEGKGLSKGCMAGLIVAGVLIVLAVIVMVLGYLYRDDLVSLGNTTMVTEAKTMITENPPDGVDTTGIYAVLDGFVERLKSDTAMTAERQALVFQRFQEAIGDQTITADEWYGIREEIVRLYPDLESLAPMETGEEMMPDSAAVTDSM